MIAPESATAGSASAWRQPDASVVTPPHRAAPISTTAVVCSWLVGAALTVALPPAGRLATEPLSPPVHARLQALCALSGAMPADLGSALCSSMMRSCVAVLAWR